MNKENDEILYFSDIVVHSNPFELNIDFIRNECKFMDKEDIYKWILDDELKLKDLQHQLEEKDKIIDEIEKRCNQEINAATIQYERHKKSDIWQYIIAHKRILEILERGKNGK